MRSVRGARAQFGIFQNRGDQIATLAIMATALAGCNQSAQRDDTPMAQEFPADELLTDQEAGDCGGPAAPASIAVSLVRWPLADEAPPSFSRGEPLSLAVSSELDLAGTVELHAQAGSLRSSSDAVLYRGALDSREEREIEVTLDALALPKGELDMLGQIVFSALFTSGDVRSISPPLTVYFRPTTEGVDIFDEAARRSQCPDGAITPAGRIAVQAAITAYESIERPGRVARSIEGQTVGYARLAGPRVDDGQDAPPDDRVDEDGQDAPPDDQVFDDRTGGR